MTTPGLREAGRALRAHKGKATDADRPPPSMFPGRRVNVLGGQMQIGDQPREDGRSATR